jgi:uncharacterized protein
MSRLGKVILVLSAALLVGAPRMVLASPEDRVSAEMSELLIDLIKEGNEQRVIEASKQVGDLNKRLSSGDTLLTVAAAKNRRAVFGVLLDRGADMNATGASGWTPLMTAIYFGHHDLAAFLLDRGAAADIVTPDGTSARTLAEWRGDVELAKRLPVSLPGRRAATGADLVAAVKAADHTAIDAFLQAKVPANSSDDQKNPALVLAVMVDDHESVRALLHHGAPVDQATPDGITALMVAAYLNRPEIANTLLEAGADPKRTTKSGASPLALAYRSGANEIAGKLRRQLPSEAEDARLIAVSDAVARGDLDGLKALIAQGVDPNGGLAAGMSVRPLVIAAYRGNAGLVDFLVKSGADINVQDERGTTPLMAAIAANNQPMAQALVQGGANVSIRNAAGIDAMQMARAQKWSRLAERALYNRSDLRAAIASHDATLVSELLSSPELRASINESDTTGPTLVSEAIAARDKGVLDKLIKAGALVNPNGPERAAPLVLATATGDRELVNVILSAGADVWQRDKDGSTAEIVAQRAGFSSIAGDLQSAAKSQNRRINAGLVELGYLDRVDDSWTARNQAALERFQAAFPHFQEVGSEQALQRALASTARVCNATTQRAYLAVGNEKRLRGWFSVEAGRCMWIARETTSVRYPDPFLFYAFIGAREKPSHKWGGAVQTCVPQLDTIDIADPVIGSRCSPQARSIGFRRVETEQMREAMELR